MHSTPKRIDFPLHCTCVVASSSFNIIRYLHYIVLKLVLENEFLHVQNQIVQKTYRYLIVQPNNENPINPFQFTHLQLSFEVSGFGTPGSSYSTEQSTKSGTSDG